MWRNKETRRKSAKERLVMAQAVWNWTPHKAQKKLFLNDCQIRVAACGRRWGKTECLAFDLVTLALEEAAAGRICHQVIVAPTEVQVKIIGERCHFLLQEAWAKEAEETKNLHLGFHKTPVFQLTLAPQTKRHQILAALDFRTAGLDGHALRGLSAHRITVDEAAYVPEEVLEEVLLPMLSDCGGDLLLASSPAGRRNAFYRHFALGMTGMNPTPTLPFSKGKGSSPSVFAQQCPSTDNPHLDHAWLAAMTEEIGESRYAQEFLAQFVDDYGAVFRADDIDNCLLDDPKAILTADGDLVSKPVPEHLYSVGIDWGRKLDYTVIAIIDGTAPPCHLVALWRRQGMSWETQCQFAAQKIIDFAPLRILCDGSSIGDPVTEALQKALRALGGPEAHCPAAERFIFTPSAKMALIDTLNLALSAQALRYPAHRALLSELRNFEYGKANASGSCRMAAAGSGHDDIVMAVALANYCAPQGPSLAPSECLILASSLDEIER